MVREDTNQGDMSSKRRLGLEHDIPFFKGFKSRFNDLNQGGMVLCTHHDIPVCDNAKRSKKNPQLITTNFTR